MPRVDESWLVNMALGVLEEVAARADLGVEPLTRAIRLVLGYLWWVAPRKERWPFHNFWIAMAMTNAIARNANLNASLNAIYLVLGRNRGMEAMARAEAKKAAKK